MPPKPVILAFDTAAAHCAAVLVQGAEILASRIEPMAKGQAERLFPLLEEVLAEADCEWSNLSALAVGTGPGNFTGIRISVAAARGLSLSLGVPSIGVPRPDAMVFGTKGAATTLIDARQNRFYVQSFTDGSPIAPIQILEQSAIEPIGVTLSDATLDTIESSIVAPQHMLFNAAQIAAKRMNEDNPKPAPLYIRAPDAALPSDPPPTILP